MKTQKTIIREALAIMECYRNDTMLRDQPHMLAVEADKAIEEMKAALNEPDATPEIELCYNDGFNPFARLPLKVLDYGVSDNIYVVGSDAVDTLIAKKEPDGEPVAWVYFNKDHKPTIFYVEEAAKQWSDAKGLPYFPLHPHPAPEEWISVDDRLPEERTDCVIMTYLCFTAEGYTATLEFNNGAWGIYDAENEWNPLSDPNEVTHWQPLPAAPVQP